MIAAVRGKAREAEPFGKASLGYYLSQEKLGM
jgi:hypothetical protein